jgi:adenine deaminase
MIDFNTIEQYIQKLPKAELHLHIEGSFEPELMFKIAKRNNIKLKYSSVEDLNSAYNFSNLQSFLDIYYQGASVLLNEIDFYDLTMAYFQKAYSENIVHAEIFFDPQTHTNRGIPFSNIILGISKAMEDAKVQFGISSFLILSFLRHLTEEEAFETLRQALPYSNYFVGIGLDSTEFGNPPQKFERVFEEAKRLGYKLMAHAGEEGPFEYIQDSIDLLKIDRIDHGNNCLHNEDLVNKIVASGIALTVCPLSNLKLKVVNDLKNHPLKTMLKKGIKVTINSDDPAYFGGYINDNYIAVAKNLDLSTEEIKQFAINSIDGSFLEIESKRLWINKIEEFHNSFKY